MAPKINRERLAATFIELCEIDSPSRHEANVASYLKETFFNLGASEIFEDDSAKETGSDCGNLVIRFDGSLPDQDPMFFSCHMDTVEPATGVEVVRTGDIFTSKHDTVLGADDKSGLAAIIEMIQIIKEQNTPHPCIELVITTCEEIGLLGAKCLDYNKIQSKYGYALDSSGIDQIVVGAPAANKIEIAIQGKAAHAGLCPEDGINALTLAAKALSNLTLGRIDEETTCNFGLIEGGVATNIIPPNVILQGEVRSHSPQKLADHTKRIFNEFESAIQSWLDKNSTNNDKPEVSCNAEDDYPVLSLRDDSPVIKRVQQATELGNKTVSYVTAGGGSDANIFCGYGLPTAIIATGMEKVHTIDEQQDLNDLVSLTELLYWIATCSFSGSQ